MESFQNISGLNINSSKTEGMWIGSFRGKMEEPFSIKWPKTLIKALGVYFTLDPKLLKDKNFIERLDSSKKLLNVWSSRGLSLYGKVLKCNLCNSSFNVHILMLIFVIVIKMEVIIKKYSKGQKARWQSNYKNHSSL